MDYVSSWPSGFDENHILYREYNKNPISDSETTYDKTVVEYESTWGYIYWHWCKGQLTDGPGNRLISDYYTDEFCCFHAFYSSASPSNLSQFDESICQYANEDCCKDSYWYYYIPVVYQRYESYKKQFVFERFTDWSDWSPDYVAANSSREVETRTVYRYAVNNGE